MKTRCLASVTSLVLVTLAPAQEVCRDWSSGFARPGFGDQVLATVEFGGELYAGGLFNWADGRTTHHVARWDGTVWSPVGLGVGTWPTSQLPAFQERVAAMTVFDDGTGPALYVAGHFDTAGGEPASHIARWDGTSWSPLVGSDGAELSTNSYVETLGVYQGTSGPELIVGGAIQVLTTGASFAARWDGTNWLAFPEEPNNDVHALLANDDGAGSKLYVAGEFGSIGALSTGPIARWDGVQWEAVPAPTALTGTVNALVEYDAGAGIALHALGRVRTSGFGFYALATYANGEWVEHGSGGGVEAAAIYDVGSGPELFVGGAFSSIEGQSMNDVARWDGTTWRGLPIEPKGFVRIETLTAHDDGSGERLFAGGQLELLGPAGFAAGDQDVGFFAAWDGGTWSSVGSSFGGPSNSVFDLEFFDDGSGNGTRLHMAGSFTRAGGLPANRVARWDGSAWAALGDGADAKVQALEVFDDGSGSALYAGGDFDNAGAVATNRVARWDGTQWSAVGGGVAGDVQALIAYDDGSGPALYAGGSGMVIERWDGSAWSPAGVSAPGLGRDFAVHDSGSGPKLYAAGSHPVGGAVYEWDGASWTVVGTMDLGVEALASFDDGGGSALYAAGNFNQIGGVFKPHIARWDGTGWSTVGSGFNNSVRELIAYDDGGGERLIATGVLFNGFALAWDGVSWSPFQGGLDASARASAVNGAELWLGGGFDAVDGLQTRKPSWNIARFGPGTGCEPETYCTAGTTSGGCNAQLSSSGFASAALSSGFFIDATGVPGEKQGLFYFGLTGQKATPWGASSSWFCVKGPHQRLPVQSSGGTAGACDGSFSTDFNDWMAQNPGKAPGAGVPVFLQAWFRDPPAPKTTAFSNAMWFFVNP
jgi:hypothetical protein